MEEASLVATGSCDFPSGASRLGWSWSQPQRGASTSDHPGQGDLDRAVPPAGLERQHPFTDPVEGAVQARPDTFAALGQQAAATTGGIMIDVQARLQRRPPAAPTTPACVTSPSRCRPAMLPVSSRPRRPVSPRTSSARSPQRPWARSSSATTACERHDLGPHRQVLLGVGHVQRVRGGPAVQRELRGEGGVHGAVERAQPQRVTASVSGSTTCPVTTSLHNPRRSTS